MKHESCEHTELKKTLIMLLMAMLLMPLSVLWWWHCVCLTWGWFVVPAFHISALPALGLVQLIGLRVVVILIAKNFSGRQDPEVHSNLGTAIGVMLSNGFVAPAVLLAFGWLIHCFT